MDFSPTEEQVLLRNMVRQFLADRVPASDIGKGPMGAADWQAMGELGLLAVTLPEAAGGLGGGPQDAAIVAEELGRALAITPFAEGILGAAQLLSGCDGHDGQLASIVAGHDLLALAEGDVDEDDGHLTGSCQFVRWGLEASAYVVVDGERAWHVAGGAAGLTCEAIRLADGSLAATLSLEGCAATTLKVSGGAVSQARAMAQLGYVAELVGIMAMLFEQTADYAQQRRQFGLPIGTFQVVQHKLARMFIKLEQSRSLLLKASLGDTGATDFLRNNIAAKAYVAEAAQKLAEDAVQVHGGMGVTDELAVGRALRRVLVLTRLFGRADEARQALAA